MEIPFEALDPDPSVSSDVGTTTPLDEIGKIFAVAESRTFRETGSIRLTGAATTGALSGM